MTDMFLDGFNLSGTGEGRPSQYIDHEDWRSNKLAPTMMAGSGNSGGGSGGGQSFMDTPEPANDHTIVRLFKSIKSALWSVFKRMPKGGPLTGIFQGINETRLFFTGEKNPFHKQKGANDNSVDEEN